ncbi:MAG: hypothetical protein CMM50_09940 [Rhodospirillaceae bacterium]|nr:hypothetical protein [Rhodospirillaceae bacterium]|tara:strand:- start:742 stop:1032 length:291 start_codon:yes stop_codon:yes gene_type:complete
MTDDTRGFLRRWSKLKAARRAGEDVTDEMAMAEEEEEAAQAQEPAPPPSEVRPATPSKGFAASIRQVAQKMEESRNKDGKDDDDEDGPPDEPVRTS